MQKRTDFFDNSLLSIVPDIPLVIRNKPHNNQLCTDLFRFISAYPVVSHFLRFAWQTTAIGFLLMHLLFSYVSSLTKSLLCFEVALETASGIVGISAFALLFIAVLAVMLYCKFRTLSGINLSDTVREYDR